MMETMVAILALLCLLVGSALLGYAMAKGRQCPAVLGGAVFATGIALLVIGAS